MPTIFAACLFHGYALCQEIFLLVSQITVARFFLDHAHSYVGSGLIFISNNTEH